MSIHTGKLAGVPVILPPWIVIGLRRAGVASPTLAGVGRAVDHAAAAAAIAAATIARGAAIVARLPVEAAGRGRRDHQGRRRASSDEDTAARAATA